MYILDLVRTITQQVLSNAIVTTAEMHFSLPSFSQLQSSCTRFIDFIIGYFFARDNVSPPLPIKYS